MNTKNIYLFVFDTKENFAKSKQFLGEAGVNFKDIICVESYQEFEQEFERRADDDRIFLAVHVFFTGLISGIRKFVASGILKKYGIGHAFISDGNAVKIKQDMAEYGLEYSHIYKYHEVETNIESDKFNAYTKREIRQLAKKQIQGSYKYEKFTYAVLTALYEDEFEELKKVFDFNEDENIVTETKVYYVGYLKTNKDKKVVASFANAAGMVDSAIIATQMLEFFRPDYLIMTGVSGGAAGYEFGDVIVAQQVFTYQKGKISDILVETAEKKKVKIQLYDINQQPVDDAHLYDSSGNQVVVSVEKFTPDNDAAIEIAPALFSKLKPALSIIQDQINVAIRSNFFFSPEKRIKVEMAPIACSMMVINKEGYFEDMIRSVHRKTAAVEMESYGVARACIFANDGKTKFIIFKSVMDHTFNKSDEVGGVNWKKFAAHTSAQFLHNLLNNNVI